MGLVHFFLNVYKGCYGISIKKIVYKGCYGISILKVYTRVVMGLVF
jgi:hypothetical protein